MNIEDLVSRFGGPSGPAIAVRLGAQLPFLVSLVAVILLAWYLARLIWLLYPAGGAPQWTPPAELPQSGPVALAPADYASIAAAHLFGEVSAEAPSLAGDAALNAPDTSLSLQLRGSIAADDPRMAHAIIADSSGNERVYFTNGSLPGGATVQRIQSDLVVLARAGQLEVLRLPREGQPGGSGSRNTGRATLMAQVATPPPQPAVPDIVAQGAAGFLDVVRPQPFMPNGQLKGYRIYPGPNRQQFASLGLRAGDLVTEINGIALDNPAQGMEVFRSLGEATQVTVTVERDGQPQVLSLNMSQINALGATQ